MATRRIDREMMKQLWAKGHNQREISELLACSKQRISQIMQENKADYPPQAKRTRRKSGTPPWGCMYVESGE